MKTKKTVTLPKKETYSLDEFVNISGGDSRLEAAGGWSSGCTDGCGILATQWNCTSASCTNDCSGSWGCMGTTYCP